MDIKTESSTDSDVKMNVAALIPGGFVLAIAVNALLASLFGIKLGATYRISSGGTSFDIFLPYLQLAWVPVAIVIATAKRYSPMPVLVFFVLIALPSMFVSSLSSAI